MSERMAAGSAAARRRGYRPGPAAAALPLVVAIWAGAPGDVLADTIVLKSGEAIEGSIIDATRNTVVVQPAIGGMRQMSIREIAEVRIELAQGQRISGQLLGWADGVYQVRSGGQVVRIAEGDVLDRGAGGETGGETERDRSPSQGAQTVRMAAAPATSAPEGTPPDARERAAAEPSPAVGEQQSAVAAGQTAGATADEEQSAAVAEQTAGATADEEQSAAAAEQTAGATADEEQSAAAADAAADAAAGEEQRAAADGQQSPAADAEQNAATGQQQRPAGAEQDAATGEEQSTAALDQDQPGGSDALERPVAVKASVAPADPGADRLVFRIELSRPVEQPLVLIYGTVEGTAKAGEDFEPQRGMVTLAPGTRSASVLVPLIERPPGQGEKQFHLFLAADPTVAEIVDRRVVATINGGDG